MKLSGLHLLLTYQCNFECEHCFVWGSPWQSGTMRSKDIADILDQAEDLGTVTSIYFEGGEPFLYYPILMKGIKEASRRGFHVGIVSNAYWATDVEDSIEWLLPFDGLLDDLSISSDLYHFSEKHSQQAKNAIEAAEKVGLPLGVISVAHPEESEAPSAVGQLPIGDSAVMYRGRAAHKLTPQAPKHAWDTFTECPFEDLREPGRVHIDPFGYLHVCQGISLGNMFQTPLSRICEEYDPDSYPIVSELLRGGPAELVRSFQLSHAEGYSDACHLCYEARMELRERFPDVLTPDQMYGVVED